MNDEENIEKKIAKIKSELMEAGLFRAGALAEQYNVCGKAGCKCKDKKHPQKHGHYYQLSYYLRKKHKSAFVRDDYVKQIQTEIDNYRKAKDLFEEWTALNTELSNLRLKAE